MVSGALPVTALAGVAILEGVAFGDDRGELRKVVRREETERAGLELVVDEVIVTTNDLAGTVRGMHLQVAPFEESKTLWVTHGRLLDVLVDARPDQPTYGRWAAVELAAGDVLALHVPPGVAHGYQTLEDGTSLTYLMRGAYSPDHARTLRFDDPTVGIEWPLPVSRISAKDQQGVAWPLPS